MEVRDALNAIAVEPVTVLMGEEGIIITPEEKVKEH